ERAVLRRPMPPGNSLCQPCPPERTECKCLPPDSEPPRKHSLFAHATAQSSRQLWRLARPARRLKSLRRTWLSRRKRPLLLASLVVASPPASQVELSVACPAAYACLRPLP